MDFELILNYSVLIIGNGSLIISIIKTIQHIRQDRFYKTHFEIDENEYYLIRNKWDKWGKVLSWIFLFLFILFIFDRWFDILDFHSTSRSIGFMLILLSMSYDDVFLKRLSIMVEIGPDKITFKDRKKKSLQMDEIQKISITNPNIIITTKNEKAFNIPLVKFESDKELSNIKALFNALEATAKLKKLDFEHQFDYA